MAQTRNRRSDLEVLAAVRRAAHPPALVPMFGPQLGWSGDRPCSEIHGVIRRGSTLVCMKCHRSGIEHRVRDHVKPNSGRIRDEWREAKPTPTVYSPPEAETRAGKVLRGGLGS